jgi:membrane carboxypeptidase/penicillin-binding protein PbpC
MFRSILRATGAALFLIVVGTGAVMIYFWADASSLMTRADDKGWLPPANDAPLSTFEATLAKAEFGENWDVHGVPCRAVALAWEGLVDPKGAGPPPVSHTLAREFRYGLAQNFDFWNGPKEIALACLLEGKRSDAALMRLWLAQAFVGRGDKDVEAASQRLFGKPSDKLDAAEAAKLAALVAAPNIGGDKENWDRQTKLILESSAESAGR